MSNSVRYFLWSPYSCYINSVFRYHNTALYSLIVWYWALALSHRKEYRFILIFFIWLLLNLSKSSNEYKPTIALSGKTMEIFDASNYYYCSSGLIDLLALLSISRVNFMSFRIRIEIQPNLPQLYGFLIIIQVQFLVQFLRSLFYLEQYSYMMTTRSTCVHHWTRQSPLSHYLSGPNLIDNDIIQDTVFWLGSWRFYFKTTFWKVMKILLLKTWQLVSTLFGFRF